MKRILVAFLAIIAMRPSMVGSTAGSTLEYVAHEWGTFTSVQGADGEQINWNPLNVVELPAFVYSLAHPGGLLRPGSLTVGKTAFVCRQRMETPVIYFYARQPRAVQVAVDFPEGTVTEWYPQATFANLKTGEINPRRLPERTNGLRWPEVQILGRTVPGKEAVLATDPAGSHYFAARETDANLISVAGTGSPELEKFLFYRGVGTFRAPLTVRLPSSDESEILVENAGAEELRHLFVYAIREGRGTSTEIPALAPGESRTVRVAFDEGVVPLSALKQSLAARLEHALIAEGLYPRESAAMVKTWDASWFGETGVRVLYTLPRAWTDRMLPLQISPLPEELVRVMIGRAEVLLPNVEKRLEEEVTRFTTGDSIARAAAVENSRKLDLGRFAEAALRRILARGGWSREFVTQSWELLAAISKPELPATAASF